MPAIYAPTMLDAGLRDGVAYLCHAIMAGRVRDRRLRETGFTPLKREYMRKIIGRNQWADVRGLALDKGIVQCDEGYRAGHRAKSYRLLPPYSECEWQRREIEDKRLARRLSAWRAERARRTWQRIMEGKTPVTPEVCRFLWSNLRRLSLPEDAPIRAFGPECHIVADKINRGEWYLTVDAFGRVHSNVTNLKKELRRLLLAEGKPLAELDIANSQPLFLGVCCLWDGRRERQGQPDSHEGGNGHADSLPICGQLLINQNPNTRGDIGRYIELCEGGKFYDCVHGHIGGDSQTVKRRTLATFYDRGWHKNGIRTMLEREFPTLMQFCRDVQRDDYRRLAHLAQRTESTFMYGQVIPRLMREFPGMFVATVHDSILCWPEYAEDVQQVMLDEFRRLGVRPIIRITTT